MQGLYHILYDFSIDKRLSVGVRPNIHLPATMAVLGVRLQRVLERLFLKWIDYHYSTICLPRV